MATVVGVEGQLRAVVSPAYNHGCTTVHVEFLRFRMVAHHAGSRYRGGACLAVDAQRGAVCSALPHRSRVKWEDSAARSASLTCGTGGAVRSDTCAT